MNHTAIIFTAPLPLAVALPGYRGGPAPYASEVLTVFFLSAWSVSRRVDRPANDNGGAAA